jgi:hypothetical protein
MNNGKSFFKHGDLVQVDGYETRIFEILGYCVEHYYYPDEQYTDIVFEISDVHTGEILETDETDLTLLCRQPQAQAYVDKLPHVQVYEIDITERKLSPREESSRLAEERKQLRKMKAEIVDDLLDRIRDYRRLYAMFGDEEFSDVVFALEAEINKLNEES